MSALVLAAVLLLFAGGGVGFWLGARSARRTPVSDPALAIRLAESERARDKAETALAAGASGVPGAETPGPVKPVPAGVKNPPSALLADDLRGVLKWVTEMNEKGREISAGGDAEAGREFSKKFFLELSDRLLALRERTLADPEALIGVLRGATGRDGAPWLLLILDDAARPSTTPRTGPRPVVPMDSLPPALRDGLVSLLHDGTPGVQSAILHYFGGLGALTPEAVSAVVSLLESPSAMLRAGSSRVVRNLKASEGEAAEIRRIAESSSDSAVVAVCLRALAEAGAANDAWVLEVAARNRDPKAVEDISWALMVISDRTKDPAPQSAAVAAALALPCDSTSWCNLVSVALSLPYEWSSPLVDSAAGRAPDERLRKKIEEIAALLRSGERRLSVLRGVLYSQD